MEYSEKAQIYEQIVQQTGFELKGKNNLYTSHNGHMFSFLGKDGILAFRFSEEEKKQFIKKYDSNPVIQYGATMKGYIEITDKMLEDTKNIVNLLRKSFDFVNNLKPKKKK